MGVRNKVEIEIMLMARTYPPLVKCEAFPHVNYQKVLTPTVLLLQGCSPPRARYSVRPQRGSGSPLKLAVRGVISYALRTILLRGAMAPGAREASGEGCRQSCHAL